PAALLREKGGICHLACRGATSWHGFATAIFEEGRKRGLGFIVRDVDPIPSRDYPTPARRPANSRLDLTRLRARFGIETPEWRSALGRVMDEIAARDGGASPADAETR